MATTVLKKGSFVRVRGQPSRHGLLLEITEQRGRSYGRVQFATGPSRVPSDQLEPVPTQVETPVDHLRRGHLEAPETLRRHLAHIRLSGRLSDMLYSLEATDTTFFAHQFKPVLKLLASPTGHLLIADEVGLGKTIEAGLIWTELAARHRYGRLLVVCPKSLCDKWQMELSTKFDLDAQIMGPAELLNALSNPSAQRRGFAAICGLPSIRPRPKAERGSRPSDHLADMIDAIDAFDDRVDLLVIDEAHHLRNQGTQSNAAGRMLSRLARHVVMLSATPINLRSEDLHALLTLVDPDTFRDPRALNGIIDANMPLIAARDALLAGAAPNEIRALLDEAASHPMLAQAQQLVQIREEVATWSAPAPQNQRASLAARIENVNLLANVVNRTRRRDVEEHRVIRDAKAWKADMGPMERDVYDRATNAIVAYAAAQGHPDGFLTVMPQRMLASCMPAAVAHWLGSSQNLGFEDGFEDDDQDLSETPLKRELATLARELPSPIDLEAQDTKFRSFMDALTGHLADHPNEKVVVFSTFHGTLDYLFRRLSSEGIGTSVLDSRVKDRTELLRRFQRELGFQVLLSSEVGSEGIDLQFATAVINYDLPWNPMRVEQRIGRIDRLGQTAKKVTILNLMHRNTVDERIWDRLYDRLKLCERALGGFESILGTEIKNLEKALLAGDLNDEDQRQLIDQTAQAIENVREHEERLEGDAAALIAHGDYVLREIRERKDGQRWISPEDIVDYLHLGLGRLHPQSRLNWTRESDRLEIKLDAEARHEFEEWGKRQQIDPGPLARAAGSMTYRLGAPDPTSRVPRISQAHPLLRYISDRVNEAGTMTACAVAVSCQGVDCGLIPGRYGGILQEWTFGSRDPELKLAIGLVCLDDSTEISIQQSDSAVRRALDLGRPWTSASEQLSFQEVADQIDALASDGLGAAFDREADEREIRAQDRLSMQLATLERGAKEDRERIHRAIRSAGPRLEAANRKRLELLEDRVSQRRLELRSRADSARELRDVGVILLNVES